MGKKRSRDEALSVNASPRGSKDGPRPAKKQQRPEVVKPETSKPQLLHLQAAARPKHERAQDILALQSQLTWELQQDAELRRQYAKKAGRRVAEAALNLGQVLTSEQSLAPQLLDRVSGLPAVPNLDTYLDSNPATLPVLPDIPNPAYAEQTFTHRATLPETVLHSNHSAHYERLEFLGDAYIELIATRLLYGRYPDLAVGRLSYLREQLVRNDTLAEFSLAYGFDGRARLPEVYRSEAARGQPLNRSYVKVLGDIFEAYVAAVVQSDPARGFGVAETWLQALWRRRLPDGDKIEERLNPLAKGELARRVMGKGISVGYEDAGPPLDEGVPGRLTYRVAVRLTGWGWKGVELGRGRGWSKQDAGVRAAMEAGKNPLTGQISVVKAEYDRLVKAEREREGGPDEDVLKHLDFVWKESAKRD